MTSDVLFLRAGNAPSPTIVPFHDRPLKGRRSARVGWVVAENGCHIWQGAMNGSGYGVVGVEGRNRYVHRLRYEREVGPIPEGMHLDHFVCDNPSCCNPAHVRPVTPRENLLRGNTVNAAHAAKTHCPQGHPYAGDNLRVTPRTGGRQCRACDRRRAFEARRATKQTTLAKEIA